MRSIPALNCWLAGQQPPDANLTARDRKTLEKGRRKMADASLQRRRSPAAGDNPRIATLQLTPTRLRDGISPASSQRASR